MKLLRATCESKREKEEVGRAEQREEEDGEAELRVPAQGRM